MTEFAKIIEEAKKMLEHRHQIIVMFSGFIEPDICYEGKMVDEMMVCGEGEHGVIASSSLREGIETLGLDYVTILDTPRTPKLKWPTKAIKIKED